MIWYRLVRTEYISLDSDFVSGEHAKGGDYRWHRRSTAAVYVAETPATAIAECGKYWICDPAQRINNALSEVVGRPPADWITQFKPLAKIDAYLAEIDIDASIVPLDLSCDPPATSHFGQAGYGHITMVDVRKNAYLAIPGKATCHIGNFFAQQGQAFVKAQSARTNDNCGILFPGNYDPKMVRVVNKKMISMFALDAKHKRIDGNSIVKLNEDVFEYDLGGTTSQMQPLKL